MARKSRVVKTADEEADVACLVGTGKLRQEVWQDSVTGKISALQPCFHQSPDVRRDNGRVLGYDVAHGYHHRHFMGKVENIDFPGYEKLSDGFFKEVAALRKKGRT